MTGKGGGAKEAAPTDSRIYLNGREVQFTAYNIDGNNYFKLRDIGEAFDFGVDWDGARNTIVIDTGKGYTMDGGTTTPTTLPTPVPTPEPTLAPTPTTPSTPTNPPSGSIDNKILGEWSYSIGTELYIYHFNSDGTFVMVMVWEAQLTSVEGTFYTSNNTVYLKNLVFEYSDTTRQLADQESTYSFGTDEYGGYLMIKTFKTSDSVSESAPIHKFRK